MPRFFDTTQPTISIWLLTANLFKDDSYHHHFQLWDRALDLLFNDQCSIHIFELEKWNKPDALHQCDNWLYFFKEAGKWKKLPKELRQFSFMRQAMATLKTISDKTKDYYEYCKRQDSIRVHVTDLAEKQRVEAAYEEGQRQLLEMQIKTTKEVGEAQAKVDEAQAKTDVAQQEVEQLRAKLKEAGLS